MSDKKHKHKSKEKQMKTDFDRYRKKKETEVKSSNGRGDGSRNHNSYQQDGDTNQDKHQSLSGKKTQVNRTEANDGDRDRDRGGHIKRTKSRSRSKTNYRSRDYGHSSSSRYETPHLSRHEKDRSSSTKCEYRSTSSSSPPPSSEQQKDVEDVTNLVYFSFLNFKNELTKILIGHTIRDKLVNDVEDFWMFLNKYETTLRNAGKTILPEPPIDNAPNEDSKNDDTASDTKPTNLVNIERLKFSIPFDNLYARLSSYDRIHKISEKKVKQFLQIVLRYLDFLQHDKFMKIKKLEKMQAELPIAMYREEIIAAVTREQVVLVAGDTGCGKSTQVPQVR